MIPKKLIVMSGLSIFAFGYCTSRCFSGSSSPVKDHHVSVVIEPEHQQSLEQKIASPPEHQPNALQPSVSQKPPFQQQQQQPQHQVQATANTDYSFQGPLQEEQAQRAYQQPLQQPSQQPATKEQQLLRRMGELQHLYLRKVSRLLPYEQSLQHSSLQRPPRFLKEIKCVTQDYTKGISKEMHYCYGELKAFLRENFGGGGK